MLVDLGEPAGRTAWTVVADDGRPFAVFVLADGTLRVTDAACPHNGGPLVEGRVGGADGTGDDGGVVVCPWHWYRFSLATGACLTTDRHTLAVHPVVAVDGRPHAEVGDAPRPRSWSERLRAHAREG